MPLKRVSSQTAPSGVYGDSLLSVPEYPSGGLIIVAVWCLLSLSGMQDGTWRLDMLLDLHPQIPREKTHGPRSSIQEEQEHRAINLHRAGSWSGKISWSRLYFTWVWATPDPQSSEVRGQDPETGHVPIIGGDESRRGKEEKVNKLGLDCARLTQWTYGWKNEWVILRRTEQNLSWKSASLHPSPPHCQACPLSRLRVGPLCVQGSKSQSPNHYWLPEGEVDFPKHLGLAWAQPLFFGRIAQLFLHSHTSQGILSFRSDVWLFPKSSSLSVPVSCLWFLKAA